MFRAKMSVFGGLLVFKYTHTRRHCMNISGMVFIDQQSKNGWEPFLSFFSSFLRFFQLFQWLSQGFDLIFRVCLSRITCAICWLVFLLHGVHFPNQHKCELSTHEKASVFHRYSCTLKKSDFDKVKCHFEQIEWKSRSFSVFSCWLS